MTPRSGRQRTIARTGKSAGAKHGSLQLGALPPTDEGIRRLAQNPAASGLGHEYLKRMVKQAEEALRSEITAGDAGVPTPATREAFAEEIERRALKTIREDEPALTQVINATGVVLHTNLGRAILAEPAIAALERAARSAVNLEYDLKSGARGDRDALVERELSMLTGAEAATVVNNNAAAVLLALSALAAGREVIVSRGELIEIGGSFRIPDVMAASGARMREVGTTNRTHPRDYVRAIGPDTALLMKVHPSNYRVVGFTREVSLGELVKIGREHHLDVIEDLGAGALVDMAAYGLPREPIVAERIAAGAALVTFSGDKLLGGPQAGLIVGRRALIDKLKANPLKRALRCDKLTLAALLATLRLYLRSADLAGELPTLRLMRRTVAELRAAAARARDVLLERLGAGYTVEVIAATAEAGSGALPGEEIESVALRVTSPARSCEQIARLFRRARPPVIGRINEGAFLLDMRTVEEPALLAVRFAD